MAKALPRAPLAPTTFPSLPEIAGVQFAAIAAGIRYQGRDDLLLITLPEQATTAGVFTRSLCPSAAIDWCRAHIDSGSVRAFLINSGNANAFTGKLGVAAAKRSAQLVAEALDIAAEEVMLASTGVIGEPLPVEPIENAMSALVGKLGQCSITQAAEAIRTTDTYAKGAGATCQIDGKKVAISGIAKGSGMIAPDMATMLAFVFTDAQLPAQVLQKLLTEANRVSFNSITVDGDTSTSDCCFLSASGQVGFDSEITDDSDPKLDDFKRALTEVMIDLAQQVVKDGEGAKKFVTIKIKGAQNAEAARRIGLAIGNSPLVKTAIAGGDANWGRLVMAVGKSGEWADRDRLQVWLGDQLVARDGQRAENYDEAKATAHYESSDIQITVDVGVGTGEAVVWTCDLTHGYIDINADYRS